MFFLCASLTQLLFLVHSFNARRAFSEVSFTLLGRRAIKIIQLTIYLVPSQTRRDTPQVADDKSQDITGQTKQVLAQVSAGPDPSLGSSLGHPTVRPFLQVDALLARAGSDKSRLLMVQIFLKDISQFPAMNAVWDSWVVPGSTPPRATVQALLADSAWLIEVVVTAAQASGSKL